MDHHYQGSTRSHQGAAHFLAAVLLWCRLLSLHSFALIGWSKLLMRSLLEGQLKAKKFAFAGFHARYWNECFFQNPRHMSWCSRCYVCCSGTQSLAQDCLVSPSGSWSKPCCCPLTGFVHGGLMHRSSYCVYNYSNFKNLYKFEILIWMCIHKIKIIS